MKDQNLLTEVSDTFDGVDKVILVRVLIKSDIKICIRAVCYDSHLHSIWTKVGETIC